MSVVMAVATKENHGLHACPRRLWQTCEALMTAQLLQSGHVRFARAGKNN